MIDTRTEIRLPVVVRGTLTNGLQVRLVSRTEPDSERGAGWEASKGVDADGCHHLAWFPDSWVAEILIEHDLVA